MTEEEAKKILMNTCCFGCEVCYEDKKGCNDCEIKEATKMAIEALEKQIPKKIELTIARKKCSNCNYIITNKGCTKLNVKYCYNCGQKIDWREEE